MYRLTKKNTEKMNRRQFVKWMPPVHVM